jgi:hypothetical protein
MSEEKVSPAPVKAQESNQKPSLRELFKSALLEREKAIAEKKTKEMNEQKKKFVEENFKPFIIKYIYEKMEKIKLEKDYSMITNDGDRCFIKLDWPTEIPNLDMGCNEILQMCIDILLEIYNGEFDINVNRPVLSIVISEKKSD